MHLLHRHSIDVFNNRDIAGWIFHSWKRERPISLRFVSGKREIGTIHANQYRKDVQLNEVHPTGRCGFDFNFPADFDVTRNKTLDIYLGNKRLPFRKLSTKALTPPVANDIPPILFMHIPKTAGTSFNTFMRMHVPFQAAESHIEQYSGDKLISLSRGKRYLAGHLPLNKLKKYFQLGEFDCYSIVREPYRHLHSHLNWLKGIAAHPGNEFFNQHNPTIRRLAKKVNRLDFSNLQQVQRFVFGLKDYELDFFDNCQTRYFLNYRPEKVSRHDFDKTVGNINLFKHIGLTEDYTRFRKYIASSYSLPVTSFAETSNRSLHPRLYDTDAIKMREILFPLVHTDILLYSYIKQRFS